MGRYSKSYSNFILREKHQNIDNGVILERDWVTIGSVHRLEPGKKPYYSDSGFIFTDNNLPFFKKKHDYGKWVAHFVYDDVKDATGIVNEVKVNTESDDLRSYVYYGSAEDLVRGAIENIIKTFPGRLSSSSTTLSIQDSDGSWIETYKYILSNPFGIDMHTETTSVADFENELHYLTSSYMKYNVVILNSEGGRFSVSPIKGYEVSNAEGEILNSEKYHNMGYDFLRYKDFFFKWEVDDEGKGKFVPVTYSDDCTNYFVKCDEYIRYRDIYYAWSYDEGRYFALNVFEICNDNYQKIYTITIKTEDEKEYVIDMYRVNGENVYCSFYDNIIIEPNEYTINSYFDSLEGFEKKLLTRKSKPLYRNIFKVPYQLTNGYYGMVDKEFIWPSNDYCINIESMTYTSFINEIMDAALLYDEVYSDCIWRCMTHESIKNFDWTYRREYTENDALDNIEGGERMMEVLRYHGFIYDEVKRYVDGIRMTNNITYIGYDNLPDAEISDKNDIKGWDITSTIWEPYYYTRVDTIPENEEAVPFPFLPINVSTQSPEYISVGCEENAVYYHKEYNDPSSEFLKEEFLDNEDYIIGKENPWINHNHNAIYINIGCDLPEGATFVEMLYVPNLAAKTDPDYILVDENYYRKSNVCYVEIIDDPMSNYAGYWNDTNTFLSVPSTITSTSPELIRVMNNGRYLYYSLTDSGFNNEQYQHERWFKSKNPNAVTPLTSDITFQRNLHLSTNRIFKTKGTRISIDMVMALFGIGGDDYSITEFYNYTTPVKANDIFYFYEGITSEPSGVIWDETNTFSTLEDALVNINENSSKYIKIVNEGGEYFYEINKDYSYEQIIVELYRHKEGERLYNDVYTGVPLNNLLLNEEKYIIPYYNQKRVYDGYLYFQEKGGWGKKHFSNTKYDYSETIPYLHLIPNVSSLLSIISNNLSEDDVYYVYDITDYIDFDEDVPFNLSHYFKIVDRYNPQRFSSWKNIPMEGEIVYNVNYNKDSVTHEDYIHAKYLNDIIPIFIYNNPHTGNGNYDLGREFYEYMKQPYKYSFDNYNFDDSRYVDIAKQFIFSLNNMTAHENSDKIISISSTDRYHLNDKLIILKNNLNNVFHKMFLKDVVLKYVLQVIPSTAILVLEGFEIEEDMDNVRKYNLITKPNNIEYGETSGDGEYIDTTFAVLRASSYEGYHFVRWERVLTDENEVISEDPITQVRVCEDSEYVAVFEKDCLMDAVCDTTCSLIIGCETAEICSTTLLCEVNE